MSTTKTVALVDVTIERGRDVLTVAVPEHEVRVLQAVHGPEKVKIVGDADDDIELAGSADAEYDRLLRKYQRVGQPDPARIAYPMGPSQLEAFGFALGRGELQAAPQASVKKHPKPKAVDKKAAK